MATSLAQRDVLSYASPNVRSSPPRTFFRMFVAALFWCGGKLLTALRFVITSSGYAVLGTGIALRFAFSVVAMILLFLGGLRWEMVKRRTLCSAQWVDAKVLNAAAFFRRRLLSRSAGDIAR